MRYTVTHSCGHTATHNLYGSSREREWRLTRLASEPCLECRNKAAAEANRQQGLPALTGTERQIRWAESIRQKLLQDLDKQVQLWLTHGRLSEADRAELDAAVKYIREQSSASWWIDRRLESGTSLLREAVLTLRRAQEGSADGR